MNKKEKRERLLWSKMREKGKTRYLFYEMLYWGLPMALLWSVIVQISDYGWNLASFASAEYLTMLFKGVFIFSAVIYFQTLYLWRKFEKKYGNQE